MEIITIGIIIIVVLAIVFCCGYVLGASFDSSESQIIHGDLYCFECENDMPVKEKNGRFYCGNCGLYHGVPV